MSDHRLSSTRRTVLHYWLDGADTGFRYFLRPNRVKSVSAAYLWNSLALASTSGRRRYSWTTNLGSACLRRSHPRDAALCPRSPGPSLNRAGLIPNHLDFDQSWRYGFRICGYTLSTHNRFPPKWHFPFKFTNSPREKVVECSRICKNSGCPKQPNPLSLATSATENLSWGISV